MDVETIQKLIPLGFWLELAEKARVRYIPAEFGPEIPMEEIHRAMDHEGGTPRLIQSYEWLNKRIHVSFSGTDVMARWECCSSSIAKAAAAKGELWSPKYARLDADDPRLLDCTVTPTTRMVVRPWVEALRVDGYPLEFRVFYNDLGLIGVSSYYPQRPLPLAGEILSLVRHIIVDANMLWNARSHDENYPMQYGFSADFMVTSRFEVTLIEGGPPHWEGMPSAHPCCFAPGKIEGIALEPLEGALTG